MPTFHSSNSSKRRNSYFLNRSAKMNQLFMFFLLIPLFQNSNFKNKSETARKKHSAASKSESLNSAGVLQDELGEEETLGLVEGL